MYPPRWVSTLLMLYWNTGDVLAVLAAPFSCRENQALAAGSETRRQSVDGRVCLMNSPRPARAGQSPTPAGPPPRKRGLRVSVVGLG